MDVPAEGAEERLRLVVGLGNPGPDYRDTRHNVGFLVVEELARRWGVALGGDECRTRIASSPRAMLAQPQTFMNRSGHAARCLVDRNAIAPGDVLVVFDDVHLPLGAVRMRPSGGPGGHRGLESVLESLRTDEVPRLRLGVREGDDVPAGEALVDFVLGPFPAAVAGSVREMVGRAADACECWLADGIETAMNRFNG